MVGWVFWVFPFFKFLNYLSFFFKKFCLFMAVLGLLCCAGFSLIKVDGLLIAAAPRVATHGLSGFIQ